VARPQDDLHLAHRIEAVDMWGMVAGIHAELGSMVEYREPRLLGTLHVL
jgi:hypothetical protein